MNIKDLAVSTELSHEVRAGVRGGSIAITQLGSGQGVFGGSGLTIATQENGQTALAATTATVSTNVVNLLGTQLAGVGTFMA